MEVRRVVTFLSEAYDPREERHELRGYGFQKKTTSVGWCQVVRGQFGCGRDNEEVPPTSGYMMRVHEYEGQVDSGNADVESSDHEGVATATRS